MNVTCDKCNKRYSIADEKVRGKSVKIRCKQCQNLISVQGPAAGAPSAAVQVTAAVATAGGVAMGGSPWEEERTRAMPALDLSPTWFAMVKGKQIGPLTLRDLETRVKAGELSLRTYLWKQGMADWKRASDVPEVSPVFAGVSVGAAALGAVQTATPAARPGTKSAKAVSRDVATSNEVPSPEITRRPNGNGNANGNGNGHHGHAEANGADGIDPMERDARTLIAQPFPTAPEGDRSKPKSGSTPKVDKSLAATSPSDTNTDPSPQPAHEPIPRKSGSRPGVERKSGVPAQKADARPLHGEGPEPITHEMPPLEPTPEAKGPAPLNDLFADVSGLNAKPDEPLPEEPGTDSGHNPTDDPFAALGEADPKDAPPPGEATKFFIAQAGVNKRNPPWKIALFVFAIVGVPVGVLFLLSTLHVVPPVLVKNDKGELEEQSFFSPTGLSVGFKDLLSGEAKKKKAELEAQKKEKQEREQAKRLAAKDKEKLGTGGTGNDLDNLDKRRESKTEQPKYTKEELEKLYGSGGPTGSNVDLGSKNDVGPKVRLESQAPTVEKGGGLDAEAVAKTMGERMKALVGCVEDALKRNPNVKLEKVVLVLQVGTSGAVKAASLEPKRVELTDWGGCIRERAKKITFPPADSESEIQIPLVLGAAIQ